jgi:hypothetical protein
LNSASGNGTVYHNEKLIGYAIMKQVDIGLQIGGKALIEVIFFFKPKRNSTNLCKEILNCQEMHLRFIGRSSFKTFEFQDGVGVVTKFKLVQWPGFHLKHKNLNFSCSINRFKINFRVI